MQERLNIESMHYLTKGTMKIFMTELGKLVQKKREMILRRLLREMVTRAG